jgi:phytoene desaturase
MSDRRLLIVGGGLSGLSAGCYARAAGYRTTIVEHNLALGGVCTAWTRGPYTIDGCIQWLTGGAFSSFYRELGILPKVELRPLERFTTYKDLRTGVEIAVVRDLDAFARTLEAISPKDKKEIRRLIDAARKFAEVAPPAEPRELETFREGLSAMWSMRHQLGDLVHFRRSMASWTASSLESPVLGRLFNRLAPSEAPALVLLMILGYLERGWLSVPVGGTASFRDALVETYERLGGDVMLHATVDEIIVESDRVLGVRLADGSMLDADVVISTSSTPETVLRLLGGRYGATETKDRLARWKLFEPIVLASFGAELSLEGVPSTQLIDGVPPFTMGGRESDHLYVRVWSGDPAFAPKGHSVVQATFATSYEWWATRGNRYAAAKDEAAEQALAVLEPHLPGLTRAVRVVDVSTPITYWSMARSWRGAYEGWIPSTSSFFGHIDKKLPDLEGFYMAGQWVEPGGGVPLAVLSGRQAVQLLCADDARPFVAEPARGLP